MLAIAGKGEVSSVQDLAGIDVEDPSQGSAQSATRPHPIHLQQVLVRLEAGQVDQREPCIDSTFLCGESLTPPAVLIFKMR